MKFFKKQNKTAPEVTEPEIDISGIVQDQTIWHPGIYGGRDGEYTELVCTLPRERVIELVQARAKEDGEWLIANGYVGENNESEPKMRNMMAWVSDETHIIQCIEYGSNNQETVDWICRDLANGSKWAGLPNE